MAGVDKTKLVAAIEKSVGISIMEFLLSHFSFSK